MDADRNVHEAMYVEGPTIRAVGSAEALRGLAEPDAQIIDLHGRTVLPGFIDSHTHIAGSSISLIRDIDFDRVRQERIQDVLDAVAERVAKAEPGEWICGIHLRMGDLAEKRFPLRSELDTVAPRNPVVLSDHGNHKLATNSPALELAGITRDTPDPDGGSIERDERGEPSGILNERGKLRLGKTHPEAVIPMPTPEEHQDAMLQIMRHFVSLGVTCVYDMVASPRELRDYQVLKQRGALPLRVRTNIRGIEAETKLSDLVGLGLRTGFGDEWLRLGAVKFSIDGSDSAHNAALYQSYPGDPDNRGLIRIEQEELDEAVRIADANGLQVAIHAIGQRAVDMALDAIERARKSNGHSGIPHRIEHAYQPAINNQLERMRELDVIWSTQIIFYYDEGEYMCEVFGPGAEEEFYPLRKGKELGLTIQLNSDFSCASPDPFLAVHTAVTRKTIRGVQLGSEQAISVDDAIAMMTTTGADSMSSTTKIGSLETGHLADFVVLDRDPYEVPHEELKEVGIVATAVGGDVVFGEI